MEDCRDLLGLIEIDVDFLNQSITADESWIFQLTKNQNVRETNGTLPIHLIRKKARMRKSNVETMLVCFVDSNGIVYKRFCLHDNILIYLCFVKSLKGCGKSHARETSLKDRQVDAASYQCAYPLHYQLPSFRPEKNIPVVPQPPYSPDLSSRDSFLFRS